ncbi:MAG: ankyrin repeat domain-containing protein [Pseudomonadales bacterium]
MPLLLNAGADPVACRLDGGTPLASGCPGSRNPATGGRRRSAGARSGRKGTAAYGPSRRRRLAAAGVDVRDTYGLTPLHHAALTGNLDQVDWLLANGANPALESTAVYAYSEDAPGDAWHSTHNFDVGTRAYDIARWQHRRTRFNTSRYTAVLERLDRVTPRRGWFSR